MLHQFIRMLQPRRLIAIGNHAALIAHRMTGTRDVVKLRHPSYGGQTQLIDQMQKLYGLRSAVG